MPGDGLGGVLGEVVPQMPAVGDVHRAGGPITSAFGGYLKSATLISSALAEARVRVTGRQKAAWGGRASRR